MDIIYKDCIFDKKYLKDEEKKGFNLIYKNWDNFSIFKKPTFGEISLLLKDIPLNKITCKSKEILELKYENICANDISDNGIGYIYKCMSYINNGNNHVIDFNLLKIKIKDIAKNSKPDEYKSVSENIKNMITKSADEKIKFIYDNDKKMRSYIDIRYTDFSMLFGEAIDGIKNNNYLHYNKYCDLLIDLSEGYIPAHASILIILEQLFDRKLYFYFKYSKNLDKTLYDYIIDYLNIKKINTINSKVDKYYNNNYNELFDMPNFSDFIKKDFMVEVNENFKIKYNGKILNIGRLDKKDICILNQLANDSSFIGFGYNNEITSMIWFYCTLFKTPDSFKMGCDYGIITNCNYKDFIILTNNYSNRFNLITNYNNVYFNLQKDYYSFRKSFLRDFRIQYFYNSFALSATFIGIIISLTGIIQVIQGFIQK